MCDDAAMLQVKARAAETLARVKRELAELDKHAVPRKQLLEREAGLKFRELRSSRFWATNGARIGLISKKKRRSSDRARIGYLVHLVDIFEADRRAYERFGHAIFCLTSIQRPAPITFPLEMARTVLDESELFLHTVEQAWTGLTHPFGGRDVFLFSRE